MLVYYTVIERVRTEVRTRLMAFILDEVKEADSLLIVCMLFLLSLI